MNGGICGVNARDADVDALQGVGTQVSQCALSWGVRQNGFFLALMSILAVAVVAALGRQKSTVMSSPSLSIVESGERRPRFCSVDQTLMAELWLQGGVSELQMMVASYSMLMGSLVVLMDFVPPLTLPQWILGGMMLSARCVCLASALGSCFVLGAA